MKFSKFGRATLAAVLSLGVAAAFTACGPNGYNNTVDYVYVTNAKTSQINVYYTDCALRGAHPDFRLSLFLRGHRSGSAGDHAQLQEPVCRQRE